MGGVEGVIYGRVGSLVNGRVIEGGGYERGGKIAFMWWVKLRHNR